tara:strand:+ start:113 stop:835 length:723 start_codon:yes stop_codon:yes gene_type:complete
LALNAGKIKQKSNFERPEPLEPGTYPVRVVQILSLGLQPQRPYKGEEKDPKNELMVTYECLDEFMKDKETGEDLLDKPRWLSETFTINSIDSDLAKSTKRYLALDPEMKYGGDWAQLGGTPAMMTVVNNQGKGKHSDKVYENITGLSAMRAKEASKAPELKNPVKIFDIDNPDMKVFGSLPEWIQTKMKDNLEFGGSALERALEDQSPQSGGEGTKEVKKDTQTPSQEVSDTEDDDNEDW